eukprot:GILI01007803.1.p1 GENE.GILI01007803.1~~GILI01007803.1.p1  ORF type:complete len:291 (+),score=64.16 GILI01007803.1:89-961(+)
MSSPSTAPPTLQKRIVFSTNKATPVDPDDDNGKRKELRSGSVQFSTTSVRSESQLRFIHLLAMIVHFYEASVALFFSQPHSVSITVTSMSLNEHNALVPTVKPLVTFSIQYILFVFFFFAGIHSLISILPGFYPQYLEMVRVQCNSYRWIEYSLTAPLVSLVMTMVLGICDVGSVLYLCGTISILQMFGWVAERYPSRWTPHVLGWLVFLPYWFYIFWFMQFSSHVSSLGKFVIVVNFILFNLFGVHQTLHKMRVWVWKDFINVEIMYIAISVCNKSLIGYALFSHMQLN